MLYTFCFSAFFDWIFIRSIQTQRYNRVLSWVCVQAINELQEELSKAHEDDIKKIKDQIQSTKDAQELVDLNVRITANIIQ